MSVMYKVQHQISYNDIITEGEPRDKSRMGAVWQPSGTHTRVDDGSPPKRGSALGEPIGQQRSQTDLKPSG